MYLLFKTKYKELVAISRNTRKVTESTPTTDNKLVGVAVGVRAEEVKYIIAKV